MNRYDPAREEACRALGLGYGEVFVDRAGSDERSHEISSNGDRSCFINGRQAFNDRQERGKYRTEDDWKLYESRGHE